MTSTYSLGVHGSLVQNPCSKRCSSTKEKRFSQTEKYEYSEKLGKDQR